MGARLPHRSSTSHSSLTKAFLLELAAQLENVAGKAVYLDPDDKDLQQAVADRLAELAARKRDWTRQA